VATDQEGRLETDKKAEGDEHHAKPYQGSTPPTLCRELNGDHGDNEQYKRLMGKVA
jgi:hypothetical protein